MTMEPKEQPLFDTDEVVSQFTEIRPTFEQFSHVLTTLVRSLLDANQIQYELVSSRAKDIDSFREKLSRKGKAYTKPLEEVTDLVGIRIVTYDLDAVRLVSELIKAEFQVDWTHSVDKSTELRENEFGYLSVHYVVKLNAKRSRLPEYSRYSALKAEVQIRTVLQHAWSVIDHKLRYKRAADVPRELKRRLYRLSGLFELADDEFSRIIKDEIALRETAASQSAEEFRTAPVNAITLEEFIKRSECYQELSHASSRGGIVADNGLSDPDKSLSETAYIVSALGIKTIGQLEEEIISAQPWAQRFFEYLRSKTFRFANMLPPPTIVELVIMAKLADDLTIKTLIQGGYDPEFAREVRASMRAFEKEPRDKDDVGVGG